MAPLLKNLRSKIHLYEKNIDDSLLLGAAVEICFEYILAAVELLRELNQFHNILRLFDVLQIFLSRQVKQSRIITYKHGIDELTHELPNDLRLKILGN